MNKKVLIISYYWPPSGGSGVQRWVYFVKYLSQSGWQPIVFVPENPQFEIVDYSLLEEIPSEVEVIKFPITEPYRWFQLFNRRSKKKSSADTILQQQKLGSWKEKLSVWIRGNLFIPDARMLWIRPSSRYLTRFVREHDIKHLISTGPPHTCHMIAFHIKKELKYLSWIADFRDPWTQIDFFKRLQLTKWADQIHHRLEKKVLSTADRVVAVGWHMASAMESIAHRTIDVIPNGFDPDTFNEPIHHESSYDFTITHIGTLRDDRNDLGLWQALSQLTQHNEAFRKRLKIILVGHTDPSVIDSIRDVGLEDVLTHIPHVPHDEVPAYLYQSQILLLMLNRSPYIEGIITGKIFEYLASGKAILCTGSNTGDAARIINQCSAGYAVNFDDPGRIELIISEWFNLHLQKKPLVDTNQREVNKFSRKMLTKKVVAILQSESANTK